MTTGVYIWSQTASNNSTADSSINWAEGQSPSTVNDSARAMMAQIAKWRDDIAGAIVTGGTSTAYTVTSNQGFDTLAHMDGKIVAFSPNATNTGACTLNVDALGAKPLRSAPSVEFTPGDLISGTPYVAIYNNSNQEFYVVGGNRMSSYVPLGVLMPYTGSTAPNSRFVFPYGQAISRTTYASYFSLVGTTYGTGDGSTTFNVPDLRGRIPVPPDNMGGSAANRVTTAGSGVDGTTIGATGGEQAHTLVTGEIPAHSHGVTDPGHTHAQASNTVLSSGSSVPLGINAGSPTEATGGTTQSATTGISINNAGGGGAHNNMQPSIVLPFILRII